MPVLKEHQILDHIKNGSFSPVYFLFGEEDYHIDELSHALDRAILDESARSFNYTVFYGKDAKVGDIIATCRRFPMMSERQLVVLKEAQMMNGINDLTTYLQNPAESTVFIINYKNKKGLDKRKQIYKLLNQHGSIFESKKLYLNQVPTWINSFVIKSNYKIDPEAAMMLADYIGTDQALLKNEIEKLFLNLEPGSLINSKHIQDFVGIHRDYNLFELQKAVGQLDIQRIMSITDYFARNPKASNFHITMAVGSLYNYLFRIWLIKQNKGMSDKELAGKLHIHPFILKEYRIAESKLSNKFIKDAIGVLRDFDMKGKGLGSTAATEQGELFREMIGRILAPVI